MSCARLAAALFSQAGSAIRLRPSPISSASPFRRMASASAGSVIRPVAISGTPFSDGRSPRMISM